MRVVLFAALALGGCASSIMEGFVGDPLQTAMVRYGPPQNAFDMGDGRRAFQWSMTSSYTTPTQVTNTGNAYPIGNTVWWTQNTQISGGQTFNSECIYTLYGSWDDSASVWRVTGFEKPDWTCE